MDHKSYFLELLTHESAHMSLDEAIDSFPLDHINDKAPQVQYSFWHILEHIRIAQYDLIQYVQDPKYVSPEWPTGYWPKSEESTDKKGWERTVMAIKSDWESFVTFMKDPAIDIFAPVSFADNKSVLRSAFLIIDHTSYHLGEFGVLRQTLNLWPNGR